MREERNVSGRPWRVRAPVWWGRPGPETQPIRVESGFAHRATFLRFAIITLIPLQFTY